jgi:hypothetical protein
MKNLQEELDVRGFDVMPRVFPEGFEFDPQLLHFGIARHLITGFSQTRTMTIGPH